MAHLCEACLQVRAVIRKNARLLILMILKATSKISLGGNAAEMKQG
jgi:hypothetical protein